MPVSLAFDAAHHYADALDGIEVPITLCIGRQSVDLLAKLDTGAAHCIFERKYAEMLGVDVDSGRLQRFRTVAGSFVAYQHEVTIQTLGIEFSAAVFFAQDSTFNRNFLGRSGWLDRLRIAIVDYDRLLFMSPYQS
jgi:predicted aspartyl protease